VFVQATRRVERSRVFCKLRDRLPVSSWVVRIVSVLPVARVVSTLLYHSTLRLKVQDQRMRRRRRRRIYSDMQWCDPLPACTH
jgi:hypothetical protein